MRKLSTLSALGFVACICLGAQAQKPARPALTPTAVQKPIVSASNTPVKVTGAVKGAPAGRMFVVATPRKGPVNVDAASARYRYKGKFTTSETLKSGASVQATGAMNGTWLKASEVEILRIPGSRTPPKAKAPLKK